MVLLRVDPGRWAMNIALAIPTCQWDPHRVQSLANLKEQLKIRNDRDECSHARVSIFPSVGPTPNWVWSGQVFDWLADQDTEWSMLMQDDVVLVPDYWDVLRAALAGAASAGAEAFCLFTIPPPAGSFAQAGANWLTTTDWMVGPNWIVKTSFMREFAWEFRAKRLRPGWNEPDPATNRLRSGLNEDTLLGLACAAYGKRIWHPLPSLVDHDTSVPSTYGNGQFAFNKSSFNWKHWGQLNATADVGDLRDPAYWMPRNPPQLNSRNNPVPHLGCAYSFTTYNFLRWCRDDGDPWGDLPWEARADQIRNDHVNLEKAR